MEVLRVSGPKRSRGFFLGGIRLGLLGRRSLGCRGTYRGVWMKKKRGGVRRIWFNRYWAIDTIEL